MKTLLTLIFFLFLFSQVEATTYYVRKTGADGTRGCTNSGADACLTINYAIGKMSGGDTLDIGAGTFAESIITFNGQAIPSGQAGANTVIRGAGIGSTIITGDSYPYARIWIAENRSFITLQDFTCDSVGKDGYCISIGLGLSLDFNNVPHDIIVQNIEGKNVQNAGAVFGTAPGAYNVLWSHLVAHMESSTCNLGQGHCHGLYISGDRNTIEYSDIYNNEGYGIHVFGYTKSTLDGQGFSNSPSVMASNAIIRFNRIHDNSMSDSAGGVVFGYSNDSIMYSNLVWNNRLGIQLGCCSADNTLVYGNTIYNNNVGTGVKACFAPWSSSGTTIRNNICYQNNGGDFVQLDVLNPGSYTEDHNLFNATNPQFLSTTPGSGNFLQLASGSPAINAGVNLGSPYNLDIAGVDRGSTWDIGAYEYQPTTFAVTSLSVRANGGSGAVLILPLNENTGTTPQDVSGMANHAAFGGTGNTWVTGKYGSGVHFNGNGYLTIPDTDNLDLSLFTLEAWISPDSAFSDFRSVIVKNYKYYLYSSNNFGYCGGAGPIGGFAGVANNQLACDAIPITPLAWTHIAATYDGANIKFYTNGVLVSTVAGTEFPLESGGTLQIGASQFGENFVGIIDEVRVYNVAIPATFSANDTTCVDMTFATASILRDMNCASGTTPPGTPFRLLIGSNASLKAGSDTSLKVGPIGP